MAFATQTILFTNPTEHTVKLDAIGLDPVPPKGSVEVPLTLAAPYRMDNGQRGKSAVEQVAPQLHPKDPEVRAAWLEVPGAAKPVSRIVQNAPRPAAEAPGVKQLRDKVAAARLAPAGAQAPSGETKP